VEFFTADIKPALSVIRPEQSRGPQSARFIGISFHVALGTEHDHRTLIPVNSWQPILVLYGRNDDEIEKAFATMAEREVRGLFSARPPNSR
jgi:hypothetical protein